MSDFLIDNNQEPTKAPQNQIALTPKDVEDYPEIEGALFDQPTIRQLKNLANGKNGEFTAISNYLYQSVITEPFQEKLSKTIEIISEQEMVHLRLLMNALRDFGANPTYTNASSIPWSSRYVNYEKNIRAFLEDNIRAEEEAIAEYTNAARIVPNSSLSKLLLAIAEDEMLHKKVFEQLLQTLDY